MSKSPKMLLLFGVLIVIALIIARVFFFAIYRIPQNGMYPVLPAGSVIVGYKRAYHDAASVKRGDIIVFQQEDNDRTINYIWRVVGMPGEKVDTSGDALSINGQPVQRQKTRESGTKTFFTEKFGDVSYEVCFDTSTLWRAPDVSITVPADSFFVMGDNRFDARDSRFLGTVPFSSIVGKKF